MDPHVHADGLEKIRWGDTAGQPMVVAAMSRRGLDLAAHLEAEIFLGQEPSSLEELALIRENGEVLLLMENGAAIGEAQVLYAPVGDFGSLERVLPEECAFLEAVGLVETARGRGLQRVLVEACCGRARLRRKHSICTAVREGNGASLRQFLKCGYRILGYDKTFYGDGPGKARLILERDLRVKASQFEDIQIDPRRMYENWDHGDGILGVVVNDGEYPDTVAQSKIARLLAKDFVGVNLYRSGVSSQNIMVMKALSALPRPEATRLRKGVDRLRALYGISAEHRANLLRPRPGRGIEEP